MVRLPLRPQPLMPSCATVASLCILPDRSQPALLTHITKSCSTSSTNRGTGVLAAVRNARPAMTRQRLPAEQWRSRRGPQLETKARHCISFKPEHFRA